MLTLDIIYANWIHDSFKWFASQWTELLKSVNGKNGQNKERVTLASSFLRPHPVVHPFLYSPSLRPPHMLWKSGPICLSPSAIHLTLPQGNVLILPHMVPLCGNLLKENSSATMQCSASLSGKSLTSLAIYNQGRRCGEGLQRAKEASDTGNTVIP